MSRIQTFDEGVQRVLRIGQTQGEHRDQLIAASWERMFEIPCQQPPHTSETAGKLATTNNNNKRQYTKQALQALIPSINNVEEWDAYLKREMEAVLKASPIQAPQQPNSAIGIEPPLVKPKPVLPFSTSYPQAMSAQQQHLIHPAGAPENIKGFNVNALKNATIGGMRINNQQTATYYDDDYENEAKHQVGSFTKSSSLSSNPSWQNRPQQSPVEPTTFVSAKSRYQQNGNMSSSHSNGYNEESPPEGKGAAKPFKPPVSYTH